MVEDVLLIPEIEWTIVILVEVNEHEVVEIPDRAEVSLDKSRNSTGIKQTCSPSNGVELARCWQVGPSCITVFARPNGLGTKEEIIS